MPTTSAPYTTLLTPQERTHMVIYIVIKVKEEKPIEKLINITEQDGEILVSGRVLHEFLEVGTEYKK